MRKVKTYKEFSPINESLGFGNSDEYNDLKNLYAKKEVEELKEYFYDLTDDKIATVGIWSYIGESDNGRSIGHSQSSVDVGKNHSIFYRINISSDNKSMDLLNLHNNFDNLKKVSTNLKKLSNCIDSFSSTFGDDVIIDDLSGTGNDIRVSLSLRGELIDKHTIETYYEKWKENKKPH